MKTTAASEVLQKLEVHQTNFGNPRRVITDKGAAFTSSLFKEYCEKENIIHLITTTGVPRGNGQVERIHRTIIPILTKLSLEKPEDWYKFVPKLQRCLNSSWQRSIDRTPFEILFGVRMRRKEDANIIEAIAEEAIGHFMASRDALRNDAQKEIQRIVEENRRIYNRRRKKPTKYQIGDLVAIKRTQFGPTLKIASKYLGPYKVTSIGEHDRYDVKKIGEHEGPNISSTSADYMKPWGAHATSFDEDSNDDESYSQEETPQDNVDPDKDNLKEQS